MRILVVNNVDYVGGAEAVLYDLIVKDCSNEYVVVAPEGEFAKKLQMDAVEVYTQTVIQRLRRGEGRFRALLKLLLLLSRGFLDITKIARQRNCNILYANTLRSGVLCILPSLLTRLPMLWHIHDVENSAIWRLILAVSTRINKRISVVAVSRAVEDSRALQLVPVTQKFTIYNGIDTEVVFNPARIAGDHADNSVRLLMYGRLVKWKGFHILVESLGKLTDAERQIVRCNIVGVEPEPLGYRGFLENRVKELGLSSVVSFFGGVPREKIPELIGDCDIVVHASIEPDPLPTVILESMSMQKIVIASEVGGVKEIITDAVDGYIFRPGDADSLIVRLREAIRDRHTQAINTMARRKVETSFTITQKVKTMNALYHHMTEGVK